MKLLLRLRMPLRFYLQVWHKSAKCQFDRHVVTYNFYYKFIYKNKLSYLEQIHSIPSMIAFLFLLHFFQVIWRYLIDIIVQPV